MELLQVVEDSGAHAVLKQRLGQDLLDIADVKREPACGTSVAVGKLCVRKVGSPLLIFSIRKLQVFQ